MRWLAIAVDENGDVKAAIVNDTTNGALPYGDHTVVINALPGCDSLTAIIELPDGDFRPEVVDTTTDSEAPIAFLDL